MLKFYIKVLSDGQGPVRQAILYVDRSCLLRKGRAVLSIELILIKHWQNKKREALDKD